MRQSRKLVSIRAAMSQHRYRIPTLTLALVATAAVAMAQETPSSETTGPKTPGQHAAGDPAVMDAKVAALRQAMKKRLLMSHEQTIEAAAAGLTLMLLPNTKMVVEGRDQSAAKEAACRSRLRELLATVPEDGK